MIFLAVGLGGAFVLYVLGMRRYDSMYGRRWPRSRFASFAASLATLGAALGGMDAAADRWFSAHMLQHIALTFFAAPLMLLGAPLLLSAAVFPARLVRPFARAAHTPIARALFSIPFCWSALTITLWAAHFSSLYERALENESVHVFEHALFFAAALLFWQPVIAIGPAPWKLSGASRVAYLFAAMPFNAFLGVSLYQANHVLYAHYAASGGRAFEDALADQRMGAAFMWIIGGACMFAAALVSVWLWAREERVKALVGALVLLVFFVLPATGWAAERMRAPERGAVLYSENCSSCHGARLEGSVQAPSLMKIGAGAVDFYLSTGRMPLAASGVEPMDGRPYFSPEDRAVIVSYIVGQSGGDPTLPRVGASEEIARGRKVFEENCQACHGAVGRGAAVGYGWIAPALTHANARQVAEAVRIGPGVMPGFDERTISRRDLAALIAYVANFRSESNNHGGWAMGEAGPVAEGAAAWFLGMGALLLLARFIGSSTRDET